MTSIVVLPDPMLLELVDIEIDTTMNMITTFAVTTSAEARCPLCQQASGKVHSHYTRTLADLSCFGQRVWWLVQVRRFFCRNPSCKRKIFTERLPTCAPAYARRTLRQAEILCELAFVLGGKADEQIAQLLGMTTSHDTLLRLIRRSPVSLVSTSRILYQLAF
jgi:transposase